MATRCTIKVEDIESVKVYKHYDGYPEATLPWLGKFNKEFFDKRGDDPSYKIAQLLRSSAFDCAEFGLDPSKDTGWGIINYNDDAGEEFEYTLHKDGRVSYKYV